MQAAICHRSVHGGGIFNLWFIFGRVQSFGVPIALAAILLAFPPRRHWPTVRRPWDGAIAMQEEFDAAQAGAAMPA